MSQKVKIFESRTSDGLEKLINAFAEEHVIINVSYHRREPVVNPNSIAQANQSLHCCMVLYSDDVVQQNVGCESCYNYDPIEVDDNSDLMGLDTDTDEQSS